MQKEFSSAAQSAQSGAQNDVNKVQATAQTESMNPTRLLALLGSLHETEKIVR